MAVVAAQRQLLTLITIAQQLSVPRATVARTCAPAALNRLSKLEPARPRFSFIAFVMINTALALNCAIGLSFDCIGIN